MKKRVLFASLLILSLCSWLILAAGESAGIDGYAVEPVTPGMDTGTPLETTPVDFDDLPLEIRMFSLAILISSIAGFPVELFLTIKLYASLGYRKVSRNTMLDNENRSLIYQCTQDNPGIYFNSIVRKTGIIPGTLRYHLLVLCQWRNKNAQ